MTLVSPEATSLDQLASFDLDSLVGGAVRLRGERAALADSTTGDTAPLSFTEFDRRVSALAGFWMELGLKPGERILIAGGATVTSVIALIGALRAELDVALAPLHLSGEEMLDFASDTEAVALAADAAHGDLTPAEELLSVASQASGVRLVCSLGGGRIDGVVDADAERLTSVTRRPSASRRGESRILTRTQSGEVVTHQQKTLVAAALDLVTRARIGMRLPIVTTLAPVTFAGLVAGPVAALLAGAPLLLHGPFAAADFTRLLVRTGLAHLVVPAAILPALQPTGRITAEALASLILVSRRDSLDERPAAELAGTAAGRELLRRAASAGAEGKLPPIVDLLAIGECAAVPEMRERDGACMPALTEPHYISLDERRILAVRRGDMGALEGAAVSECAEPPQKAL